MPQKPPPPPPPPKGLGPRPANVPERTPDDDPDAGLATVGLLAPIGGIVGIVGKLLGAILPAHEHALTPADTRSSPSERHEVRLALHGVRSCTLHRIAAGFDPATGLVTLRMPEERVSRLVEAMVVATTTTGATLRYAVDAGALVELQRVGRAEWHMPPGAPPFTGLVISFAVVDEGGISAYEVRAL